MKRTHLLAIAAVIAAVALFFFLRGGDGDGGGDETAKPGGDGPALPEKRKQVTMSQSAGGAEAMALIDDDPEGTLRLEGQVIDSTQDPVAGAVVTISSNPPRQAETGADGTFFFDKLVGRPYQLVARADSGIAGPVTARLTETSDPVILRLRAAASVKVTVLSATDRTPIAGASVELRDLDVQTATTGGDGVAELTNVVPGGYRLAAYAPGYAKSHTWVRVPQGNVTAVTTIQLRKGAAVSGIVVDPGGDPVEGARVTYSGVSDWSQQADPRYDATVTDAEGQFTIDALPAGSFRFVARHPSYAQGRSEIVTLDGLSEKGGVEIRLEAGATLSGRVVDTGGQPMASARVRVVEDVAGMRWARPRQAFTAEDGTYEISGLPRAPSQAVAVHETASSPIYDVDLSGKEEATLELVLELAEGISGTVVNTSGDPIEGAQVVAWPDWGTRGGRRAARGDMRLRGVSPELTDAGGRFSIKGLEDGDYQLRATPPGSSGGGFGRMMARESVSASTGDTDVRIVLPTDGGVKGTVQYEDGTAPEIFTVGAGFRGGTPFSGKDGTFEVGDLAPRTYKLSIRGPGFDPKRIEVDVKEGEVADVGTVIVTKGRSIHGRVTQNGQPVPGATVQVGRRMFGSGTSTEAQFGPMGGGTKKTTTDDQGSFSLYGVGPSDLMVVAEHEEMGRSQTYAIRGTRDSIYDLELVLQPFGALAGTVTQNGKPAEAVRISAQSQTAPSVVFGVASGADGKFRYDRLAPDTYKVSAIPGGGNPMAGMSFHSQVVTVKSGETANVDLSIDEGQVTLSVKLVPTNADSVNFAFVQHIQGEIAPRTARELELATAQIPDGNSGFSMSIQGMPVELENLTPGLYSVCAVPYPIEVSGMSDTMAYGEREGDNLPCYCEQVTVAPEPQTQSVDLEVELPEFVPAPDG